MSKHVLPHPPAINHFFLEVNHKKGLNDIPSPTTTNFRFKSGRLRLDEDGALSIECRLQRGVGNGTANDRRRASITWSFLLMPSPSSSTRRTTRSVFWPNNCTRGCICYGWMSPAICVAGVLQVSNHHFPMSSIDPILF